MNEKLTPEQAIKDASYEEEDINGSPLIVSQSVALAQIEHARQEERNYFRLKIEELSDILHDNDKTKDATKIINKFLYCDFWDKIVTQTKTTGENARMKK